MTVADESGQMIGITIPKTWIPINLSTFISPKQLVKSQVFLNAFRSQDLICISDNEAKAIMNRSDASTELDKVNAKYKTKMANRSKLNINTAESTVLHNTSQPSEQSSEQEAQLTPSDEKLMVLVDRFNRNAISDNDAVAQLEAIQPAPTPVALQDAAIKITFTTSPFYVALGEMIGRESFSQTSHLDNESDTTGKPAIEVNTDSFRS